jgi:deoxyribonuclease V
MPTPVIIDAYFGAIDIEVPAASFGECARSWIQDSARVLRGITTVRWPGNIQQAREMQERLRSRVRITTYRGTPRYVSGVDAAFTRDHVAAVACLYSFPDLIRQERSVAIEELRFPYVPGFLAFREGPAIIAAIRKLSRTPDIILVDGQGIAHPRRFGIACHIGVLLDIPAIGCAKTRLVGDHREPGVRKGSWSDLRHEGGIVGAVLRTRHGVRPLFVSPGHRIGTEDSVSFVLYCVGKYRIPEPLRCADAASRNAAKKITSANL